MNQTILAITVLTCMAFSMTEGAVPFILLKCRCTDTQKNPINIERIQRFVTIAPGPHCRTLQVLAIVKLKRETEVCVNPRDQWVKDAMAKLEQKKSNSTNTTVIN